MVELMTLLLSGERKSPHFFILLQPALGLRYVKELLFQSYRLHETDLRIFFWKEGKWRICVLWECREKAVMLLQIRLHGQLQVLSLLPSTIQHMKGWVMRVNHLVSVLGGQNSGEGSLPLAEYVFLSQLEPGTKNSDEILQVKAVQKYKRFCLI